MSSIQFLSKVTREMTNSRFVWLPLNMSVFDEMVDIFQEGIAMVTECVFSFESFGASGKCGQGLYIWLLPLLNHIPVDGIV